VISPIFKPEVTLDYIIGVTDNPYDNILLYSLLSYYVRAEENKHTDQFINANRETILRELNATQQLGRIRQLDYMLLCTDHPSRIHTELDVIPRDDLSVSTNLKALRIWLGGFIKTANNPLYRRNMPIQLSSYFID